MTKTVDFGTTRRESHDSSAFYARFAPPITSAANEVNIPPTNDTVVQGDSRNMLLIPNNSIALIVTSPPYFTGKEYEKEAHAPKSYFEYLSVLRDVFAECRRVLEPGGRIAVNVAGLGRKPYRSLPSDVLSILQDELGFLLRGEIIWLKSDANSGSCAWGSFCSASNPSMRDLTERIIVASKGSFSRMPDIKTRAAHGLPSISTIGKDDFMAWTYDTWRIPPESARRVNHPAPFPIELPRRLILLHTYLGDTVLDPFVGSGSTAIAAKLTGRHYIGYDLEPTYIEAAEKRIAEIER